MDILVKDSVLGVLVCKYLESVVGPTSKLHLAFLLVKGKPGNINLTSTLKNAWWDIRAAPVIFHYNVCSIRSIKPFVGTVRYEEK